MGEPAPRERGTIRVRMVLGLVAFVALVASVAREPPHYRDDTFLAQVESRYRKIQNDHAIAMYDHAVEELARVNAPFPTLDGNLVVVARASSTTSLKQKRWT